MSATPSDDYVVSDPMLSRAEVARELGISERTLSRYQDNGVLPPIYVGARPRWPKSTVDAVKAGLVMGPGTIEKLERKAEKMQFRINDLIRRVGDGQPLTPRQCNELRPAPAGTIESNVADALGYHGEDMQGACELALKIDADRKRIVAQVADIAAGGALPEQGGRAVFLSRVAMLRGQPGAELCLALDISTTAGWNVVRDALARRFDAKPKRSAA